MAKFVNGKNIAALVSKCGKNTFSDKVKTTELTTLFKMLLESGIWLSAKDAASRGIPAGTYVVVDDPKTKETEFTIEVVPNIKIKE